MEFLEIPDVFFKGTGVMYQYLVFDLELNGEKKTIVRGMNYQPYLAQIEDEIKSGLESELHEHDFVQKGGRIEIQGGGSIAFNRYSEAITLFGENPRYGVETDRDRIARMIQRVYPEHEIHCFLPEEESKSEKGKTGKTAARTQSSADEKAQDSNA